MGVVGAIAAWNHPQALAMVKTAPALAAGCAVVLKPALETALDACVLVETAGPHSSRKWTVLSLERIAAQLSRF